MKRMQAQQSELRQFEYSPLAEVQGWSDVPRRLPLFESVYGFENYPVEIFAAPQGGTLQLRNVRAVEKTNYPLNLMVWQNSTLLLKLFYDTGRFDLKLRSNAFRVDLRTLLEKLATHPRRRFSELNLLDSEEERQLLIDWNQTRADFPDEHCIHHHFEAQVERTPDAIALICEGEQLSFRQLNARANQLGVTCNGSVSADSRRRRRASIELVVALLGVLKAGGAYLPLDPSYPRERLAWMQSDAGVQIVLTEAQLDQARDEIEAQYNTDFKATLSGANLAYVIYTSGSTGRPKGVMATTAPR